MNTQSTKDSKHQVVSVYSSDQFKPKHCSKDDHIISDRPSSDLHIHQNESKSVGSLEIYPFHNHKNAEKNKKHEELELIRSQSPKAKKSKDEEDSVKESSSNLAESASAASTTMVAAVVVVEESGRERLKRHRVEVAGQVLIPDIWGKEEMLKDWIDCSAFDGSLANNSIMSARAALFEEVRNSGRLRIENRC